MRRVNIPIFQSWLKIYKTDEREKFEKIAGELSKDQYGCFSCGHIWIGESEGVSKISTCFHEAVHYADWLIEHRLECKMGDKLWDHTELRAYIVQYVGEKVMEYCCD